MSNGDALIQENEYSCDGTRISKTEGSIERKYIYDNGSIAYTLDNGAVSSSNILGGYQNVIGSFRGSEYFVYNKDVKGSTSSILDGQLSAENVYEYSDFGEVEVVVSGIDNEICYTGAVYDGTTGLHYMNARYYDPSNGRFISQDSYRGSVSEPGQWHLYVYCANNPINYTDPSGHIRWEVGKEEIIVWISFLDMEVAGIIITMNSYRKTVQAAKNAFRVLVKPNVEIHLAPFKRVKASYLSISYLGLLILVAAASERGYSGFRFKLQYKYKLICKRQVGRKFWVQKFTITPKVWLYK